MLDTFVQDFYLLFTVAGAMTLFHIIMIDVVLSGDNAIIIGMATKRLPEKLRKKAIMIGIIGATVLRIVFAFFTVYLLQIIGIQVAGALLLLYVVWKFYTELRKWHGYEEENETGSQANFLSAVKLIIIADVSMSLDNVLAVAGAAKENVAALWIGLMISIILMAFASNFIAKKLNEYPQIQWFGLLVILLVSIEMLLTGIEKVDTTLNIGLLNFIGIVFFALFLFAYQQIQKLKLPEVHPLQKWKYGNHFFIPFALVIVSISMLSFFQVIEIRNNVHILYTLLVLTVVFSIEYLWTMKNKRKI
jgi:YjbE family integral membrane protein